MDALEGKPRAAPAGAPTMNGRFGRRSRSVMIKAAASNTRAHGRSSRRHRGLNSGIAIACEVPRKYSSETRFFGLDDPIWVMREGHSNH